MNPKHQSINIYKKSAVITNRRVFNCRGEVGRGREYTANKHEYFPNGMGQNEYDPGSETSMRVRLLRLTGA